MKTNLVQGLELSWEPLIWIFQPLVRKADLGKHTPARAPSEFEKLEGGHSIKLRLSVWPWLHPRLRRARGRRWHFLSWVPAVCKVPPWLLCISPDRSGCLYIMKKIYRREKLYFKLIWFYIADSEPKHSFTTYPLRVLGSQSVYTVS